MDRSRVSEGSYLSLQPSGEKTVEPLIEGTASLDLTGTLNEPVRDTRDVEIAVYATDRMQAGKGPPAWIGSINGFRPAMRLVSFIPHRDFDRLWAFAMTGLLKHAYVVFPKPRYHSAFVLNLSFSTHPEE